MDINNCVEVGRLAEPVKYTPANKERKISAKATGRLAVNRPNYKGSIPKTDYIPFVAWGNFAEVLKDYSSKGKELGLTGRWETNPVIAADGSTITYNELKVCDIQLGHDSQAVKTQKVVKQLAQDGRDEARALLMALKEAGVTDEEIAKAVKAGKVAEPEAIDPFSIPRTSV